MRHKLKIVSTMSSTTAGECDLGNLNPDVYEIDDGKPEGYSRVFKITGGQTLNLDVAGFTGVEWILVKTDKNVDVTITETTTRVVPVRPPAAGGVGFFALNTDAVTAISIENKTGNVATVYVQVAGDTP